MMKVVIVDDEPKAIQSLTWELEHFKNDVEIVKSFTDPEEAIEYLNRNVLAVDCVFLDIHMPKMDGFNVLNKLQPRGEYAVIITTAYDDYAIKAIKQEALDYLLKPIDSDDLQDTIKKLKKHYVKSMDFEKIESILNRFHSENNRKKITINTDGKLIFLDEDDIVFVESDGNYSTLYLKDNQKILVSKKIKEVNALLPEKQFFRIHNSFIINLNKVKEFIKTEGYVVMSSNHKIPVARQRKVDFLENY
ncbi:MAG TPA: LytTR family DNA-binding domain-containing protein [Flavobacteriaceae bacterium]|nr:LytTR family DNA-binding domain-containing protein [Flavobacteriaceae bacterium]